MIPHPLRVLRLSLHNCHCTLTNRPLYVYTATDRYFGFATSRALSSQHYVHRSHLQLSGRCTQHAPTSSACCNNPQTSSLSQPLRAMSSDADYASFLDKANQDSGSAEAKGASKNSYGTESVNTRVPNALEQVEEYYTSDADEPFEPVALKFDGTSVSAGVLKKLIGGDRHVEEVQQKHFESQYQRVMDAVQKAGNGEAKVFRVELSGTRAEYYVVSVDSNQGRLVGLKALSVES
ncbi:hypothetical protein T440DRAFT_509946 [Plenodomus tracheiphilus IPT5]|uniref:Uncharacterized protein n=1 Tax=Plenodomus tracheiphilus IPT5 TaxID=1408161 RepID=A0A6A7B017_9PLEO|nr:hypothetical protein T440DRAFT_509946 [Plenodomus tracheiphilus IPT5]